MNLINGAQPSNVFWQIGSSATLGTSSVFAGTILALSSISTNAGVTLNGRALARNGAVTLINDMITAIKPPLLPGPLPPVAALTMTVVDAVPAASRRPFVDGQKLTLPGAGARMIGGGEEVISPLTGSIVPLAVNSRDDKTVVYNAWTQTSSPKASDPKAGTGQGVGSGEPIGTPSVRVSSDSGADKLLERGAYAPALSRNGQLAYARGAGESVLQDRPYMSSVVVRPTADGPAESWTDAMAQYFPYAWAGSTLLAYRRISDSEGTDLYALSGPGQMRLLAPDAFVVAVSPDGKRALVTVARRTVEIIRIADGAIESSMSLDGDALTPDLGTPTALMYNGSWLGDRVVANSDVGLVVLDVANRLRIESVLSMPRRLPTGLNEPTLTDASHIVGWTDLGAPPARDAEDEPAYDNALVECDLAAASCAVGAARPARMWTRWATNPSR